MNKKSLLGMIAGLSLLANVNAQSIEPHGEVSISYVPLRHNNFLYQNQLKTTLDFHLDLSLNKDMKIYLGGTETTWMDLMGFSTRGLFSPTNQDYIIYAGFDYQNLDVFFKHNCFHGFGDYSESNSGETEIGVKYKW
jgi:hypothetical protein